MKPLLPWRRTMKIWKESTPSDGRSTSTVAASFGSGTGRGTWGILVSFSGATAESQSSERTRVAGTPIAVASRERVSSEGVCRPASTRAMFGR